MDPQSSRLQHRQQEQLREQTAHAGGLEFATPEEMLRHDAAQTEVPVTVQERLQRSAESVPKPSRPWWRRWFG